MKASFTYVKIYKPKSEYLINPCVGYIKKTNKQTLNSNKNEVSACGKTRIAHHRWM